MELKLENRPNGVLFQPSTELYRASKEETTSVISYFLRNMDFLNPLSLHWKDLLQIIDVRLFNVVFLL